MKVNGRLLNPAIARNPEPQHSVVHENRGLFSITSMGTRPNSRRIRRMDGRRDAACGESACREEMCQAGQGEQEVVLARMISFRVIMRDIQLKLFKRGLNVTPRTDEGASVFQRTMDRGLAKCCVRCLALPPGGGELESVLATRSTLSKSGVVQAQFRLPLSLKYLFVNGIFCGLIPTHVYVASAATTR